MASVLHPNQAEVVIGDVEGKVKIWDLAEDKLVHTLECDWKIPIRDVTIAVDASLLVAVNNRGSCFSWNYQSTQDQWNPQHRMEAHSSYCLKAVLSPDVRFLATCSSDRTIKLWNADDQFSEIRTLSGHQRWVWDCAFSADSAYLVTASSDKSARLWEVSSGDVVMDYRGHTKSVTCIALNDCVSN